MPPPDFQRAGRQSEPGEVQRIVLSARPALAELFAEYAIPGEETGTILREAVDEAIQQCHRTVQPRRLFLKVLEGRCAAHLEARQAEDEADQNAEETNDEERPPDA